MMIFIISGYITQDERVKNFYMMARLISLSDSTRRNVILTVHFLKMLK
jgi:hypothetical protein